MLCIVEYDLSDPGPLTCARRFGTTVALDGLDLEVDTGEIHGFLGPNGAGKSTTIRILLGLLRSDSGSATLLGEDPWREVEILHRRLAYVPGDVALWPNLTGGEVIDLLGNLRGGLNEKRRAEMIERFDLDPTKKGRSYSKGNRQKVALVAALASDVELLLLDEPTSGLDPLMEAVFKDDGPGVRRVEGVHDAPVEPHPQRGRVALRPGQHHPGRTQRRVGHARPAAPPGQNHRAMRRWRNSITAEDLATVPGLGDVVLTDHHVDVHGRSRPTSASCSSSSAATASGA